MLSGDGEHKKEFSQGFKLTTNNRMELLAVIIGLENLKFKNCNVKIFTDSKYAVSYTHLTLPTTPYV